MPEKLHEFLSDERGATAIEYGMIASLIGVGIVTGFGYFADQLQALFSGNSSAVTEVLNR
ncbi:MAG TPA: Flp family type IVb pilin [Mesorhizobium sp.]|jgi:pilus assembly protein Flp/PilA